MLSLFGPEIQFTLLFAAEANYQLLPGEAACLCAAASPKRRREFTLGRQAAHQALARLDYAASLPVLHGPQREPLWPEGVVGSITHTATAAAAAVARSADCAAIGIDLETIARPKARLQVHCLAPRLATPTELCWINGKDADPDLRTLQLFSAKESVFKAFFPLCRTWFGFQTVTLSWNPGRSCFDGILQVDLGRLLPAGFTFQVQLHQDQQLICTGLALPAERYSDR